MSDIPNLSDQSGLSRQSDLDTVKTAAIGRHRLENALVHGRTQSWVDRQRLWPYAVAGLLTTGLIASGIGIAGAYEDQKNVDSQHDIAPPAPAVTTEPTAMPTSASPSSSPTTPPPTKPSTSSKPSTKAPPRKTTSPSKPDQGPPRAHQKSSTNPKQPTNDKGGTKAGDKPTTHSAASTRHEAKPKHRGDKGRQHGKPTHRADKPRHLADPTYHLGTPALPGSVGMHVAARPGSKHHRKGRHAAH